MNSYRLGSFFVNSRKMSSFVRSTAASGSIIYESSRAVQEYLLFHYGSDTDIFPYSFGPKEALSFPLRCSEICSSHFIKSPSRSSSRALDLGCSVGGTSFHLTKTFDEVLGIDFSQSFVDAANEMKKTGVVEYSTLKQGVIMQSYRSALPTEIDRSKVTFIQGDACNLPSSLGKFDVILGSNLLCRLPNPRKFIQDVQNFLVDGGLLVLVSPYSWLPEYTPIENWFGGKLSEDGTPIESFKDLSDFIFENNLHLELIHEEEVPFLIREHERKFQYGVSHCTIWKHTI